MKEKQKFKISPETTIATSHHGGDRNRVNVIYPLLPGFSTHAEQNFSYSSNL